MLLNKGAQKYDASPIFWPLKFVSRVPTIPIPQYSDDYKSNTPTAQYAETFTIRVKVWVSVRIRDIVWLG